MGEQMSETKFTPGPWQWSEIEPEDKEWGACEVWAGDTLISSHTNGTANAAMSAAAPDLYAALQAAIDCGMVPKSSASEGGAMRHSRQVQVADMIRAALAKARGET